MYNKFTISTTWRIKSRFIIVDAKDLHSYGLLHNYALYLKLYFIPGNYTSHLKHLSPSVFTLHPLWFFSFYFANRARLSHCQDLALSLLTSWKALPYTFTEQHLLVTEKGLLTTTYFLVYHFIILCITSTIWYCFFIYS